MITRKQSRKLDRFINSNREEFLKFVEIERKLILEKWNKTTFAIAFSIMQHVEISIWSSELGKCSSLIAEFCVEDIPDKIQSAKEDMQKFNEKFKELHNAKYDGSYVYAQTFDQAAFAKKCAESRIERLEWTKEHNFRGKSNRRKRAKINQEISDIENFILNLQPTSLSLTFPERVDVIFSAKTGLMKSK